MRVWLSGELSNVGCGTRPAAARPDAPSGALVCGVQAGRTGSWLGWELEARVGLLTFSSQPITQAARATINT